MGRRAARKASSRSIFLVGFMASGKSSVGALLARRLGRPFLDTDAEIEKKAGRSVAKIFARSGEKLFRRLEERAVARACRGAAKVVAVGGGAVTRQRNMAAMRRAGIVVYLEASLNNLWLRALRDGMLKRPLIAAPNPAARRKVMERLLAARRPLYLQAARLRVRIGSRSPQEVARAVARRLGAP